MDGALLRTEEIGELGCVEAALSDKSKISLTKLDDITDLELAHLWTYFQIGKRIDPPLRLQMTWELL